LLRKLDKKANPYPSCHERVQIGKSHGGDLALLEIIEFLFYLAKEFFFDYLIALFSDRKGK